MKDTDPAKTEPGVDERAETVAIPHAPEPPNWKERVRIRLRDHEGQRDQFPRSFGAYTLLRELGQGGFGIVYEAEDPKLGRRVALKTVLEPLISSRLAQRFQQEVRTCARVRHDHIVALYDADEVDGRPFFTMSLIEGPTLAELIRADELPEPRELARQMAGVADALGALHREGMVHRDVKPTNLVRDPAGRLVLLDFGLARFLDAERLTRSNELVGTPLYMAPEQLRDPAERIDGRTDLYALGATLYEALAGHPPFEGTSAKDLTLAIISKPPAPLSEGRPDLPPGFEAVVRGCLKKRPADRFASAADLRDALLALAEQRPLPTRQTIPRPGERWGPFTVLDEIARGGQGAVLKAREDESERVVALKVLLEPNETRLKRFEQEAKVLSRLEHPNLVKVHDLGEVRGTPYLSMELVEGETLKAAVQQRGVPDPAWSTRVLAPIARVLDACHAKGIVHRDLKPENILLDRDGRPVLVDFGLVKRDAERLALSSLDAHSAPTHTGEAVGTPAFMAPEQVDTKTYGPAGPHTDIHALGATLYFLLTGRAPYVAETPQQAIYRILVAPPPDPTALSPETPPALATLCQQCMAKDPAERPESAAAVARVLETGVVPTRAVPGWVGRLVTLGIGVGLGTVLGLSLGAGDPVPDEVQPTPVKAEPRRDLPAQVDPDLVEHLRERRVLKATVRQQQARDCLARAQGAESTEEAVRWVEQAFALDALAVCLGGEPVADRLLAAAREALTADSPRAFDVARARRLLVWVRFIRPVAKIDRDLLNVLVRLGDSTDRPLREAARPAVFEAFGGSELVEPLTALLSRPIPPPELLLRKVEDWPRWYGRWYRLMKSTFEVRTKVPIYEEWLLWRPELTAAWFRLGRIHLRYNRLRLAERLLRIANRQDGSYSNHMVGKVIILQDRHRESIPFFRRAIQALGGDVSSGLNHRYMAEALLQLGEPKEALKALKIVPVHNRRFAWFELRARCQEAVGDTKAAEASRRTASQKRTR